VSVGFGEGKAATQGEGERDRWCRERGREEGISLRLLLLDPNDYIASLFIVLSRLVSYVI
jgi:hypothetical protein